MKELLDSEIIINDVSRYIMHIYNIHQAFIEALLSTAVFPQRFSFFAVCLVHYLLEVPPWWVPK